MTAAMLLALSLGVSPASVATEPAVGLAEAVARGSKLTSRNRLKKSFTDLMRQTARNKRPRAKPRQVVPRLVTLADKLKSTKLLSHVERKRMRLAIKRRLDDLLTRVQRDKRAFTRARQGRKFSQPSLGGPIDIAAANELIDLIQSTISPESWDVNGGKGTIRYYSNLKVLVVRNTAEVHSQIGGTLGQLGR